MMTPFFIWFLNIVVSLSILLTMLVVAIEGPHGVGKTTIINQLREDGYVTIPEDFLELERHNTELGGTFHALKWVVNWFDKVLSFHEKNPSPAIIFTDRSFLTTRIYDPTNLTKRTLVDALEDQILKGDININFLPICIFPAETENMRRIEQRMDDLGDPKRLHLNELSRDHLQQVRQEYKTTLSKEYGHAIINNTNLSPKECLQEILDIVKQRYPHYLQSLRTTDDIVSITPKNQLLPIKTMRASTGKGRRNLVYLD